MKKSALLAVSALSLGVVGLATFTPVVNAESGLSGNASVSVTIASELGIGGTDITPGQVKPGQDSAFSTLNVNFGEITAGEVAVEGGTSADASFTKTLSVMNNSGFGGTLNVQGSALHSEATGAEDIPVGTNITAGVSNWGIKKADEGSWLDISTSANLGSDTGKGGDITYKVTYGLSTKDTQVAGQYNGTATYTYTIADLGA